MYSISDLERISGVKAHTIRMWEKRYALLHPKRTKGNHRLYSDHDLMKLLNVEQLVSKGYKISKIAGWDWSQIKSKVKGLLVVKQEPLREVAYYNNQWLQSALNYDEEKFNAIYAQLRSRMSFIALWSDYLVPAFEHMGQLWMTEVIAPVEEHFFSQLVRRKILVETEELPLPENTTCKVLLFLPPDEYHELGLLVSEHLLRMQGIGTINLGADIPLDNLKKLLVDQEIGILMTFIHGIKMNSTFLEYVKTLGHQDKEIVFNGRLNVEDAEIIGQCEHASHQSTIDQFKEYIKNHSKLQS
ncbi:MerR family transcriptional regulator [Membranicola marinus]|uniref:MerR family transcriptional regulator n=1 Tax=Membranihabitans marinus TaxID=1227546 RepID=A0A953HR30_9BACT|nr:MerR family transcriptional regulator [Membranihabitans marinus]MBY5960202.1 MerR family transcriptional regulator [Membranihabitans marinus]